MVSFDCEQCNQPYEVAYLSWKRKYCSNTCMGLAYRNQQFISRPTGKLSGQTVLLQNKILINEEYLEWLSQWKWHISSTGYAVHRNTVDGIKQTVRMHRLVINAQPGQIVDHIDRNKLNNTVENLRIVTQRLNTHNSDKIDNAKMYWLDKRRNLWVVESSSLGVRYKSFRNEDDARVFVSELRTISKRTKRDV